MDRNSHYLKAKHILARKFENVLIERAKLYKAAWEAFHQDVQSNEALFAPRAIEQMAKEHVGESLPAFDWKNYNNRPGNVFGTIGTDILRWVVEEIEKKNRVSHYQLLPYQEFAQVAFGISQAIELLPSEPEEDLDVTQVSLLLVVTHVKDDIVLPALFPKTLRPSPPDGYLDAKKRPQFRVIQGGRKDTLTPQSSK